MFSFLVAALGLKFINIRKNPAFNSV